MFDAFIRLRHEGVMCTNKLTKAFLDPKLHFMKKKTLWWFFIFEARSANLALLRSTIKDPMFRYPPQEELLLQKCDS